MTLMSDILKVQLIIVQTACQGFDHYMTKSNSLLAKCMEYPVGYKPHCACYFTQKNTVPTSQRQDPLKQIHAGHLGLSKCLHRAKQTTYWSRLCDQIYEFLSNCQ